MMCENCPHDIDDHADRAVMACDGNRPRSEWTENEAGILKCREVWDGGERPAHCPCPGFSTQREDVAA